MKLKNKALFLNRDGAMNKQLKKINCKVHALLRRYKRI